jgi:hypothetical protein
VCVSVCECVYECIGQQFDIPSKACCTDMHVQTDRHSGWIREIAAAHTLAHAVHTRTPLSCGGHMHAHVHVHASVLTSFLFFR